ncbi:multicopper oxidase domain-containing protein [Geomonas sp. RF6]|uniref:multicopper oxidase domain-containing protein n=1 Tax=Geomonas sp. RF6 TaxID=2897342 RepID=UPI001E2D7263|nr:multicopper oxidase domain-containing protein [Geomonas sp. RF6]UFS70604.1 multicopper oxidase domain-containing protein [Geomonas sp. RF6]
MDRRKWTMLAWLAVLVGALCSAPPPAQAIDETKVPHYFGPYPNWALSPLPAVDATGAVTGGIKKFVDGLPGLGPNGANNLGQYIPVAQPDTTTYPGSDYYEIGLVQYREQMHSNLPATLLRGYVQLGTSVVPGSVPLSNARLDGSTTDIAGFTGVDKPHYLGPVIVATKDRPVRILFRNLLPTGAGGDLFLPVDSTMMGSGMGPMTMLDPSDGRSVTDEVRNPDCTGFPKPKMCFKDNRATLHLHGGVTPWISDGTPHQWTTPATEDTPWPQGVSVKNVPDMNSPAPRAGEITFYYTNQQSARLMFYHDHAWGITRLNVYAGEAAGYIITDSTEAKLKETGVIPGDQDTIPLIIQDRTFVPTDKQLLTGDPKNGVYAQDPTWDKSRWGGFGNLWYHHVYMPAQNPNDPSGMSAYGRWMFGPWFWPPASPKFGPIPNPRYGMDPATNFTTKLATPCSLDDPLTWQYPVDPFCEPPLIPGTPNISVGMEQFNDTPVVNGTAYPTTTVDPKSYRLRILNAANDRFFNLQLYQADASGTEVALKASELAAAQLDPVVFPTPDTTLSPAGPSWIQIGSEGGFLPAPAVIPPQPITWITDPTRFDVGNVDQHSLVLAPAERADVIVDFSLYAGKTLILYNDAPAAYPARVASYDYYTGSPDLSPVGAPGVLPGYGPNTRTIMQIKVRDIAPSAPFDLTALNNAFAHHSDGSGVFESGQHPIIVGQSAYNTAYGTKFVTGSWCNAPGTNVETCDGLARIFDQGGSLFGFNTLASPTKKLQIPLEPKALHDEMNAVAFDEFGRMTANIGVEAVPAAPGVQNVILYPYVNPPTELIDGTNLPKGDVSVTPIATADGTQIWKITHNGVDTHPIHFHLYDVQVLNRVTWDNIIIAPDANELGWKDTVRISPLEDTIVALRPIIPTLPFDLPNSIRPLSPMMPVGATAGFENTDTAGNPTDPLINQLVNFGWEYVYHCHILSHEEMDMMRPVSLALPPKPADGLSFSISGNGNRARTVLSWNDNSISETGFLVQKTINGTTWTNVGTSPSPLDQLNTTGTRTLTDNTASYTPNVTVKYQVVAQNTVGYGGQFPSMTVSSTPTTLVVGTSAATPSNLTAVLQGGPQVSLTFTDNATNEVGFMVERSTNGGAFTQIGTAPARANTGTVAFVDNTIAAVAGADTTYSYRVFAYNAAGPSGAAVSGGVTVPALPAAPANLRAVNGPNGAGNNRTVILSWQDLSGNESGFTVQRATNSSFTSGVSSTNVAANTTTLTQTGLARNTQYWYRIRSNNGAFVSSGWVSATPLPIRTNP